MKKLISIFLICILQVATLNILQRFQIPYKEFVYSAVSVFYLLFGCFFLKLFSYVKKMNRFLRLMPLRGTDFVLILYFSFIILSGGYLLNFIEISVWERFGFEVSSGGINNMSFDGLFETLLTIAVVPAVFEELFFRGAVLSTLEEKGKTYAIVFSSLFFFIMHGSYYYILSTIFAGVVFSLVVYMTNSVLASISVHFIYNTLSYFVAKYSSKLISAGLDSFVIYVLGFILLIGTYGVISTYLRKISKNEAFDGKVYNEGELVWERKKAKRKRPVK